MADINVTVTNSAAVNATLSSLPVIAATVTQLPAIRATLTSLPAINATLSSLPSIHVTLTGTGVPGAAAADVLTLTAGEALSARDCIYRAADGKVYKATNATDAKEATGYVLTDIAQDDTGLVYFGSGIISGFTGLTANIRVFLSATPGAFATVTGSGAIVQQTGRTISDTQIYFEPQSPIGQ